MDTTIQMLEGLNPEEVQMSGLQATFTGPAQPSLGAFSLSTYKWPLLIAAVAALGFVGFSWWRKHRRPVQQRLPGVAGLRRRRRRHSSRRRSRRAA